MKRKKITLTSERKKSDSNAKSKVKRKKFSSKMLVSSKRKSNEKKTKSKSYPVKNGESILCSLFGNAVTDTPPSTTTTSAKSLVVTDNDVNEMSKMMIITNKNDSNIVNTSLKKKGKAPTTTSSKKNNGLSVLCSLEKKSNYNANLKKSKRAPRNVEYTHNIGIIQQQLQGNNDEDEDDDDPLAIPYMNLRKEFIHEHVEEKKDEQRAFQNSDGLPR